MTSPGRERLLTAPFLSPAVLGLLATWTGYAPTFLVSAVVAATGAAYLLIVPRRRGLLPSRA